TGQRLVYRKGSLTPADGVADVSGFAGLARLFTGDEARRAMTSLVSALLLVGISVMVWRWTARAGAYKFSARHLSGTVLGLVSFGMAVVVFINLGELTGDQKTFVPRDVTFLAPVQQPGSALSVEVSNIEDKASLLSLIGNGWPAVFAVAVWCYGWITDRRGFKPAGWILGWTLLAWAALRCPNGARAFLGIIVAFLLLHVVIPTLRRLWHVSRVPKATPPETGPAPAVAAFLIGGLWWITMGTVAFARSPDFQSPVSQISNLHGCASCPTPGRLQIGDTAGYKPALPGEGANAIVNSDASFPLAPALSPWEREYRSLFRMHSNTSRQSAVLPAALPTRADEASAPSAGMERRSLSPLPEGEGQGEGEQDSLGTFRLLQLAQVSSE